MRHEIELRCIMFSLIIFEMFLELDWSPPVVNSIDWTWFGKAHTCLYNVPQLTVHDRAKTKPWGQRNWSGGRVQKKYAALKVPKNTVASIKLKWKEFGTTKTILGAGRTTANRTTTLSTQPSQRKSAFGTSLWISLSGPVRARTWTQSNISGETWK